MQAHTTTTTRKTTPTFVLSPIGQKAVCKVRHPAATSGNVCRIEGLGYGAYGQKVVRVQFLGGYSATLAPDMLALVK